MGTHIRQLNGITRIQKNIHIQEALRVYYGIYPEKR